jgi:hypothetical protein
MIVFMIPEEAIGQATSSPAGRWITVLLCFPSCFRFAWKLISKANPTFLLTPQVLMLKI